MSAGAIQLKAWLAQKDTRYDLQKKDFIAVNPEKDFICWDGLPVVNCGPKFYKY